MLHAARCEVAKRARAMATLLLLSAEARAIVPLRREAQRGFTFEYPPTSTSTSTAARPEYLGRRTAPLRVRNSLPLIPRAAAGAFRMSAAALLGLAHVGLARWAGRGAPSGRLSGQRCGLPLLRGWGSWPVSPSSQPVGQPLVQRLHWLASLGDLDGAQAAMDELTPGCVGFDTFPPPVTARTPSGVPHVSYVHLFSDAAFSMGIFVLPAGAKIPLHDHPEMTVLSKLLAIEDVAIFDILLPPYNDRAGRSCHYYSAKQADQEQGWIELVEVPWPNDLIVDSMTYRGPKIKP
eukprot:scaffold5149_cov31-Tisochrysis_lutea.AAC.1